jgi:tetratricopeptide (TPR) repeat protein
MKLPPGLFLALAIVVVCSDVASADWTRLQSDNFTFIGDASERDIRRVARQLEQFREVMLRALPPRPGSPPAPVVVLVFASNRSFEPFKPRFQGRTVEVGGFFRGGADVNHIAINNALGDFAVRAVFHEYSHLLVSSALNVAPAWVNEGIAQLYETFEERNGGRGAVLGLAPAQHVLELRSRVFIPLSELMAVDHSSPTYNEGNRRGQFYAQSWALMHYLTFGNRARREQLTRYLDTMNAGASPDAALKSAFSADLPAIEKELRDYLLRLSFPAMVYNFETTARANDDMQLEKLNDAEAEGYLGDLMARDRQRTEDARARLTKAIASNPDAARAHYALGLLELRDSRGNEALPLLERAAILQPEEAAFITAYGFGLVERLRAASDDAERRSLLDRARAALSRSMELRPASGYTLATAGYLEQLAGNNARAVDLLKRAVAASPSEESYRMGLAEELARQGDYEAATAHLALLVGRGSDEDMRNQARQALGRVAQMRNLEAARAAARASAASAGTSPASSGSATAPDRPPATPPPAGNENPGRFSPALRRVGANEQRVLGVFRSIQCRPGSFVLEIQTPTEVIRIAAKQFSDIDFISYRTDTPGSVTCGPVPGLPPVLATYRAAETGSAAGIIGDAVAIELIPDGYVPK